MTKYICYFHTFNFFYSHCRYLIYLRFNACPLPIFARKVFSIPFFFLEYSFHALCHCSTFLLFNSTPKDSPYSLVQKPPGMPSRRVNSFHSSRGSSPYATPELPPSRLQEGKVVLEVMPFVCRFVVVYHCM